MATVRIAGCRLGRSTASPSASRRHYETVCRIAAHMLLALLTVALATGSAAAQSGAVAGYQEVAVSGGATLAGQVTFTGEAPAPVELLITRDFEICGIGMRERREIDVADGGGLRAVVVFITDIERGKPWPDAPDGYVLDQRDCFFAPYIQVVPRGIDLRIENSDPVLHNVHGYELNEGMPRRTLFNLAQPEVGEVTRPVRPRRSARIGLECDAHDFMLGWIFAAENPYAVVVDSEGRFDIPEIPPGTYTVSAWHPFLGAMEQNVTVTEGETVAVSFEFTGG